MAIPNTHKVVGEEDADLFIGFETPQERALMPDDTCAEIQPKLPL